MDPVPARLPLFLSRWCWHCVLLNCKKVWTRTANLKCPCFHFIQFASSRADLPFSSPTPSIYIFHTNKHVDLETISYHLNRINHQLAHTGNGKRSVRSRVFYKLPFVYLDPDSSGAFNLLPRGFGIHSSFLLFSSPLTHRNIYWSIEKWKLGKQISYFIGAWNTWGWRERENGRNLEACLRLQLNDGWLNPV